MGLAAIRMNGNALQFAPDALKNNREFMLEAIKENKWALTFAGANLMYNPKFLEVAKVLGAQLDLLRPIDAITSPKRQRQTHAPPLAVGSSAGMAGFRGSRPNSRQTRRRG